MTDLIIRTNNESKGQPKLVFTTVFERYTPGGDLIDVDFSNCEHFTAECAEADFTQSFWDQIQNGTIRIISTAVAVGGFQSDEHGGIII